MRIFLRDWPVLSWLSLAASVLVLLLAWLIPLPVFETGPVQGRGTEGDLIPLLPGTTAQGTVAAQRPGLSKVKIKVATYLRRNTCRVQASLLREGEVLAKTELDSSWFPDLEWVEVPFYGLGSRLAQGNYTVRFRSSDSDPGNAVALLGRAGEEGLVLRPVYAAERIPAWSLLGRYRPDYGRLLLVLILVLACGGLAVGVGATIRKRKRNEASV